MRLDQEPRRRWRRAGGRDGLPGFGGDGEAERQRGIGSEVFDVEHTRPRVHISVQAYSDLGYCSDVLHATHFHQYTPHNGLLACGNYGMDDKEQFNIPTNPFSKERPYIVTLIFFCFYLPFEEPCIIYLMFHISLSVDNIGYSSSYHS